MKSTKNQTRREEAAKKEAEFKAEEMGHTLGTWDGMDQRYGACRWEISCTKCGGIATVQVDSPFGLPDIVGPQLMEETCKA